MDLYENSLFNERNRLIFSDADFIIVLGIFLIPFDALKIFPLPMTYRPFSCLFFCIYEVLFLINIERKIEFKKVLFFLICLFSVFTTMIQFVVENLALISLLKFIFTIFFGLFSFFGLINYFEKIITVYGKENGKNIFCDLYIKAMIIPICFGILQLFQIVTKQYIFNSFFLLINTRFTPGRVCIASAEPAGASEYLLFLIVVLFFNKNYKGRYIIIKILSVILFAATFSLKGFMVFFCFFVLFELLHFKWEKIFLYFLLFVGLLLCLQVLSNYSSYLRTRIRNVTELFVALFTDSGKLKDILTSYDSMFVRIGNPLIGILIFFNYPLFGVGGGYYYRKYPEYIDRFFPNAMKLSEVRDTINSTSEMSSRSLIVRFFAENGFWLGVLHLKYLLSNLKISKHDYFLSSISLLVICLSLFQDSLCFLINLYILAFLYVFYNYEGESNE